MIRIRSVLLTIAVLAIGAAACAPAPTATPVPPTATLVPPTAVPPTKPAPTATPVPPTATAVPKPSADSVARGGRLYDAWWKEVKGAAAPKDSHPLWGSQTTNKATGSATWRCKECHGWDYKGKDGAYGSGSHYTGFSGVWDAAQKTSAGDLVAILKGSANPKHDFSKVLGATDLTDMANFLKEGLIDVTKYVDVKAKKPIGGNATAGKALYDSACAACHGSDGRKINFGSADKAEFVGTIAKDNPIEFIHKVRAGQPGSDPPMPSALGLGWTMQQVVDVATYAQSLPEKAAEKTSVESIARGGLLYDKWWKVVPGATEPKDDQPLWALQTSNTRKGSETWRCKECHGWDYKGKDGAYGSGSHKTGFPGVWDAAQKKSTDELAAILKGSLNPKHDFSKVLRAQDIADMANFLKSGLIDLPKYVDYASKKPIGGDAARGKPLYDSKCAACHGAEGKQLNFGSAEKPEYVGTIATDNPFEFVHKTRVGQPGSQPAMPSALGMDWTMQQILDVLTYVQALPAK
jgi:thiosulfate dehydrogenase